MTVSRDNRKALIVKKVAEKNRVSTNLVYKVLAGDRDNEQILSDYLTIKEEVDNAIVNAVKKLVPFN